MQVVAGQYFNGIALRWMIVTFGLMVDSNGTACSKLGATVN